MTKKPVTVRMATPADVRGVLEMLVEFCEELPPVGRSDGKILATIVAVLQAGAVFVAERNGELAGTMGVVPAQWWFSDEWYLSDRWMFVRKGHRRSTAARDLLKAAKAFADNADMPLLTAVANLHRTAAKNAFYRRQFTPIGEMFIHGLSPTEA